MPLYIGDYLSDTMHLSTLEHGAYILLLMAYWKNGGPLPDSDSHLSAICRVPLSDWPAVRSAVIPFFLVENGLVRSARAEKELARWGTAKEDRGFGAAVVNFEKNGIPIPERYAERYAERIAVRTLSVAPSPSPSPSPSQEKRVPPAAGGASRAKPKTEYAPNSLAMEAARFMWEYVHDWSPQAIEPTLAGYQAWARDCDLMFRKDGRSPDAFNELLDWIDTRKESRDGFSWRKNILCPATLRKRWSEGKFADFLPSALAAPELK